jgi:DNA-binding NtrC family response regulator
VNQSILLASRDNLPLRKRSAILSGAGYKTACANDLAQAICLALDLSPGLIILGHSFRDDEQTAFIDQLHESEPGMRVLCLKFNLTDPLLLLKECESMLSSQPGSMRVRSIRAN